MSAPIPADEAPRLDALRRYNIVDTSPEGAFDDLTRLAAFVCGVPIALVSLVDVNRQWFKSRCGLSLSETPRRISFCAHSILQRDVFVIPDALEDPRFADNPLVTSDPHIRFYAGAPLITPDGFALGTLCVMDRVPRRLTADQTDALRALSRQTMTQMELRSKVAELQQAVTRRRLAEEAYAGQHRIAEHLQQALLLTPPACAFPGLDVRTVYQAASDEADVGGDFCDAFRVDETLVALIVGDVVGKGLTAATFTAEVKFALRAFAREHPDPASILLRLNGAVMDAQRMEPRAEVTLVTVALAVIDTATGDTRLSAAGAVPPLLVSHGGRVRALKPGGMILGVQAGEQYEAVRFRMRERDTLLFVTDGITEARRAGTGRLFGDERLRRVARDAVARESLGEAAAHVVDEARRFAGGPLSDDACVLVARRR